MWINPCKRSMRGGKRISRRSKIDVRSTYCIRSEDRNPKSETFFVWFCGNSHDDFPVELSFFRRLVQCLRGALTTDFGDLVKITGTDEGVVFNGAITLGFRSEFPFLQLGVSGHLPFFVTVVQFPDAIIECMEPVQRHKLEFIPHGP